MLTFILLTAGIIDYRYRKIPNAVILLLFIYATLFSTIPWVEKLLGFLLTALPLFLIAVITDKIKGGDLKFLAVLGMAVGLANLAWLLLPTMLYAMIYTLTTKEKTIPLAFFVLLGWVTGGQILVLR